MKSYLVPVFCVLVAAFYIWKWLTEPQERADYNQPPNEEEDMEDHYR